MNKIVGNSNKECTLCEIAFDSGSGSINSNHSHLVQTYFKLEGDSEVTQLRGFVCCKCVTRLSMRQVPSPFDNDEVGHNALKESARIPFKPMIDWGRIEELERFKRLTESVETVTEKQARKARVAKW